MDNKISVNEETISYAFILLNCSEIYCHGISKEDELLIKSFAIKLSSYMLEDILKDMYSHNTKLTIIKRYYDNEKIKHFLRYCGNIGGLNLWKYFD